MSATTSSQQQADPAVDKEVEEILASVGTIESETPGRMRVRIRPELRTPEVMGRIERDLRKYPEVTDVQVNQRTGSVVVTYQRGVGARSVLKGALGEAALVAEAVFELPAADEEGEDGQAKLDEQLAKAIVAAEDYVYRRTGLRTHGVLVPALIAGAGVAQIAIVGISIELIPGPLLLWIAYDIYRRVGKDEAAAAAAKDSAAEGEEEPAPGFADGLPAAA